MLKIFKYLKLSSRMNSLWEVLERALSDMLAFMLILFFIMAGFGVFGVVLFGDHVREFHNVPSAFNTLLYWTIGDFSTVDYDIMTQASSAFAPVFMSTYIVLVVLVAINMFIAIITNAYDAYMEEKKQEDADRRDSKKGLQHLHTSYSAMKALKVMVEMMKPQWKLQKKSVELAAAHDVHESGREVRRQWGGAGALQGQSRFSTGAGQHGTDDDDEHQRHDEPSEPIHLRQGMTVRLHIGRKHLQRKSDAATASSLPVASIVHDGGDVDQRFESVDDDPADVAGTKPRARSKRRLRKQFQSVHFIDAAEDTENGEDALAQIVVLGMITKRKRGTRGHTVRPRCATARCGLWLMGVVP